MPNAGECNNSVLFGHEQFSEMSLECNISKNKTSSAFSILRQKIASNWWNPLMKTISNIWIGSPDVIWVSIRWDIAKTCGNYMKKKDIKSTFEMKVNKTSLLGVLSILVSRLSKEEVQKTIS